MIKKILPIVLVLAGTGAGVGAGIYLRPAPSTAHPENDAAIQDDAAHENDGQHADEPADPDHPKGEVDYVKLNNQFVIPVVKDRAVVSLVVLSLSLEVEEGSKDAVFRREPKLRDSFLQIMFDHANIGGFDGAFTHASNLDVLRNALRDVAQKEMGGGIVHDVLILEIARQDY